MTDRPSIGAYFGWILSSVAWDDPRAPQAHRFNRPRATLAFASDKQFTLDESQ